MIQEIKEIVEHALYKLNCYSDDALALVVRALEGYGDGTPAIGFWQIEPATLKDMIKNFLNYRKRYKDALKELGMEFKGDDIEISVMSNMAVQAALCRLHYRRDKKPLPSWDDMEAQGLYWKRVYNTPKGRGTIKHFIEANLKDDIIF